MGSRGARGDAQGNRARTRDAVGARRAPRARGATRSTKRGSAPTSSSSAAAGAASASARRSTSAPCCACRTSSRTTDEEADGHARRSSWRSSNGRWRALDRCAPPKARVSRGISTERLAIIEQAVDRIAARAPQRLVEQRDRLRTTIRELADGVAVDEQRLAQEVAILADRLDVAEEISRFHSHFAAFRATLASPSADGVGQAAGLPAPGAAARGQHHRQQGERRGDPPGRDPDQGGARADPRAGGEPRVNPFPVILSAPSGGGKTTIARQLLDAPQRPWLLGLVHDAGAAARRSATGRTTTFSAATSSSRRRARGRLRRVGRGARQPVRHAAKRDRAGAGHRKARRDGHRRAGSPAVRECVSRSR